MLTKVFLFSLCLASWNSLTLQHLATSTKTWQRWESFPLKSPNGRLGRFFNNHVASAQVPKSMILRGGDDNDDGETGGDKKAESDADLKKKKEQDEHEAFVRNLELLDLFQTKDHFFQTEEQQKQDYDAIGAQLKIESLQAKVAKKQLTPTEAYGELAKGDISDMEFPKTTEGVLKFLIDLHQSFEEPHKRLTKKDFEPQQESDSDTSNERRQLDAIDSDSDRPRSPSPPPPPRRSPALAAALTAAEATTPGANHTPTKPTNPTTPTNVTTTTAAAGVGGGDDSSEADSDQLSEPAPAELLAQLGIHDVPVATVDDLDRARAARTPTAADAYDAWDMLKGKAPDGFDTVCLRHRRWGTEVEMFIGSTGSILLRPDALHQWVRIYPDGRWIECRPLAEPAEADNLHAALRARPGRGWAEAMGGADAYVWGGAPPAEPDGAVPVPRGMLSRPGGWTPAQDRWGDWERFDTEYIRPSDDDQPQHYYPIPPQAGYWTATCRRGGSIVWRNSKRLCEVVLTPEGLVYLGCPYPSAADSPRAVWVEYGLAGCKHGVNRIISFKPEEARRRLGFGAPEVVWGMGESALVDQLVSWVRWHGWHDLDTRLLERGRTDIEVLHDINAEFARKHRAELLTSDTLPPPIQDEIYQLENIKIQLIDFDQRGFPTRAVDFTTRQEVWRRGQPKVFDHPWAREGLLLHRQPGPPGGPDRIVLLDKTRSPPALIAEYDDT